MLNKIRCYISKTPKPASLLLCLTVAVAIGFIDYDTGDYSITVVYTLPVYLAAKLLGNKWCIIATSFCVLEIITIAILLHHGYISISEMYIWNALIQSLELAVLGYCVSRVTRRFN